MSYPYPQQSGGYPPGQGGYPPAQGGYPPAQGGYPPAQGGYPPAQGSFPPAGQPGYPPQQGNVPQQVGACYPPQGVSHIIFIYFNLLFRERSNSVITVWVISYLGRHHFPDCYIITSWYVWMILGLFCQYASARYSSRLCSRWWITILVPTHPTASLWSSSTPIWCTPGTGIPHCTRRISTLTGLSTFPSHQQHKVTLHHHKGTRQLNHKHMDTHLANQQLQDMYNPLRIR